MFRFFFIFCCLLGILLPIGQPAAAIGVDEFVAVAEGPGNVLYNPAGLAQSQGNLMSLNHRFTGRDQFGVGWDDLLAYSVSDHRGTGELFYAYNQDLIALYTYNRLAVLGYSYGWRSSQTVSYGLTGKFTSWGIYDDSTGAMEKTDSENHFLFDFGTLITPAKNWRIGAAFHNIGQNHTTGTGNYDATAGVAYVTKPFVIAVEVFDLFSENVNPYSGSIVRGGFRFSIADTFRLHLIAERSDWSFSGNYIALEYLKNKDNKMSFGVSWYQVKSPLMDTDTVQATYNLRF